MDISDQKELHHKTNSSISIKQNQPKQNRPEQNQDKQNQSNVDSIAGLPTVSVIITVYNEAASIERLLHSLNKQTRQPDEIIICDGGSSDETVSLIRRLIADGHLPDTRLLVEAGANISRGRNLAIDAATGPIIAATDAGVRLESTWLKSLVAPWMEREHEKPVIASAGFFVPDVEGVFETAMAATVLPLVDEIEPDKFLPSSRSVAFTKDAWRAAGGYPEWLDYCEDLLFDFAINKVGESQIDTEDNEPQNAFQWSPNAIVYFQPRTTFKSFWRQYYRYARGDGKADLWRKRQLARYLIYLLVLPILTGLIFSGSNLHWLGWIGLLAGGIVYCARPWQRLLTVGKDLSPFQALQAFLLVPILRAVGDIAKMVGYPVGLFWRWQNRKRAEIHWR